jgi:diguanylate cyclase
MSTPTDEHERTMAFAEIAIGQIKALRQPASPRHFEVWYTYATGYNPSLNQTINETLTRSGTLNDSDIDRIYETYISATRFTDRLDHVGSQVQEEIEQVMAMIGAAAGSATSYSENLANVSQKLGTTAEEAAVRSIVESLVQATREMQQNNQQMESQLKASMREIEQLHEHLKAVRTESLTDPLTAVANRKSFDDGLAKAITEARANKAHLSLLMTDIDNFKKFNDRFGHVTGDQVLRLVAMTLKGNVKENALAARYGGEEFAVVLPGTTLAAATALADHVRRAIMVKELKKRSSGESLGQVTISIGIAALRAGDTPQTLIERADGCLYTAKRNGRNQVINESDPKVTAAIASKVA